MEVQTLSKTIVDEVEYTLAACDSRYVLDDEYSDRPYLQGHAHYEVRATRVDEAARGGKDTPYAGSIIGTVQFPFTAEGGQAARSTYSLLIEVAHVPLARLADGLLPAREPEVKPWHGIKQGDIIDVTGVGRLYVQAAHSDLIWATKTQANKDSGFALMPDGTIRAQRYTKGTGDLVTDLPCLRGSKAVWEMAD